MILIMVDKKAIRQIIKSLGQFLTKRTINNFIKVMINSNPRSSRINKIIPSKFGI